jgi:hypothetical protein
MQPGELHQLDQIYPSVSRLGRSDGGDPWAVQQGEHAQSASLFGGRVHPSSSRRERTESLNRWERTDSLC